jgi:hypothetical protein
VGLDEERTYRKVNIVDEMFVRIFYFVARKKKSEDPLRPETRDLRPGVPQVRRGWRWVLLPFTVNRKKFVI